MTQVVLVHGFTQTGASWASITPALVAAGHQVAAPDAPGHGPDGATTAADLVTGAERLAANWGRAAYVGYSMGARLCLHVALAHPEVVSHLVLIGATAGIDNPAERAARRAADGALADELEAGGDAGLGDFMDRWLISPLFAGLTPATARRAQRLTNTAAGLAASLRLAGAGEMEPQWDRLEHLGMPVLVLAGQADAKFAELGARMARSIGPNAELRLVPHAGHAAHLEQPERVAAEVVTFLAGGAEGVGADRAEQPEHEH